MIIQEIEYIRLNPSKAGEKRYEEAVQILTKGYPKYRNPFVYHELSKTMRFIGMSRAKLLHIIYAIPYRISIEPKWMEGFGQLEENEGPCLSPQQTYQDCEDERQELPTEPHVHDETDPTCSDVD
jgi:hypothetical protein